MSSSSILTNYIREISEAEDPKKAILKWTKGIEKEYVLSDRVIVATYARPGKTSGGVILTDTVRMEDVHMGVCGLIVALGENAFKYDGAYKFEGTPPKLHDWVVFRPSESVSISYNKASCRILHAESIMCVTKHPERWY